MPRKQDFSKSVIYHIRNKETKCIIYVGSTTHFQQRKAQHKFICNTPHDKNYNLNYYVFIRENGGWDYFEIIPIEFLKLENKTQLIIAEQVEIDKHNNLKNINKSYNTEEDKRRTEYKEKWYIQNQDRILKKQKEKGKINCKICNCEIQNIPSKIKRHQDTKKCKSFNLPCL